MPGVYAILVGVETYGAGIAPLPGPRNDAIRFANLLLANGVEAEKIRLFTNTHEPAPVSARHQTGQTAEKALPAPKGITPEAPTEEALYAAFKGLKDIEADILVIYWAGHGLMRDASRRLPCAGASDRDIQNIDLASLTGYLAYLATEKDRLQRQYIFTDVCGQYFRTDYGDKVVSTRGSFTYPEQARGSKLNQWTFYAARPGEFAENDNRRRAGVYTDALLPLLQGHPKDWDLDAVHQTLKEELAATDQTPTYAYLQGDGGSTWEHGSTELFRLPKSIDLEEFRKLLQYLAGDPGLLPTARKIASSLFPQLPARDEGWPGLLSDVGSLVPGSVVRFIGELSQAIPPLLNRAASAYRPTAGLKPNLDDWLQNYAASRKVDISKLGAGIHWISYVVSPHGPLLGRYDVFERFWPADLSGAPKAAAVDHRKEKVTLEEAVEWIEASLTTLRKRVSLQEGRFAFEFYVPVEVFNRKFDCFPDPEDEDLGLETVIGDKFPVVLRPVNYAKLNERPAKLRQRAENPGLRSLSPHLEFLTARDLYRHSGGINHVCVYLETEPSITSDSGRKDIFAAVLGQHVPAMFWFRSPTDDPKECTACFQLAKKHLHTSSLLELPRKVFARRQAVLQALSDNRKLAAREKRWLEAVLVIDVPERIPHELRTP